jgi:transcriptional regulator with XRE-family HTH domain
MSDSPLTPPIRKLRAALGLKQSEVADAVGIARPNYSRYEQGRIPDPQNAERIVDFFGPPLTCEHVMFPHRYPRFLEPQLSGQE